MRYPLRTPFLAVLLSSAALAACTSGQTDPVDQEPEVATMVLDIDQGVPFTATTSGFSVQTLTIDNPGFVINTATFTRPGGDPETVINIEDYRLSVAGDADGGPLPEGVSFTRSGPFSGSVGGIAEGQTLQVYFALFHIEPEHDDFGPFALTVARPEGGGGGGGGV